MKIICLVKFIPDVEAIGYDFEKESLVRENTKRVINPDDAGALAFALILKKKYPETIVEAVSMAPLSAAGEMKDLLRRHVDRGVFITDPLFAGSDTYVTARILARYLETRSYDCILTGTHSLDGFTAHIPLQLSEALKLPQLSGITGFVNDLIRGDTMTAEVEVESDESTSFYQIRLPAILSLNKESRYKLPYVSYKDLDMNVDDRFVIVSNKELGFSGDEVGLSGSPTNVRRTFVRKLDMKADRVIVQDDDAGMAAVYRLLREKGYPDHG
ncbi:MAG: hypothetical protein LBU28_05760 [Spirochaetaceae bacterium]|jgi:electron transfer flavoprotein beta subunit|nr:hypothetical protein [Spirochaetaceae bacterium]